MGTICPKWVILCFATADPHRKPNGGFPESTCGMKRVFTVQSEIMLTINRAATLLSGLFL